MYSPHEYGPEVFNQSWFTETNFPNNMAARWEAYFNFIITNNTAPLIIGEFGIKENIPGSIRDQWMTTFTNYIATNNLNHTFWCMNPNSTDTGGILADDWSTVNTWKMDYLTNAGILYPVSENCIKSLSTESLTTKSDTVSVTPNPATTILNIKSKIGIASISVFDLNGRLIDVKKTTHLNTTYSLKVNDFAAGLYVLQIQTSKGKYVSKFIKE